MWTKESHCPYVPCSGDEEDECKDCPGFGWFNEGADVIEGEPLWFELERCDNCKKYESDEDAASAHFEEVRWYPTYEERPTCGWHRVLYVRWPKTDLGRAMYQDVLGYLTRTGVE